MIVKPAQDSMTTEEFNNLSTEERINEIIKDWEDKSGLRYIGRGLVEIARSDGKGFTIMSEEAFNRMALTLYTQEK